MNASQALGAALPVLVALSLVAVVPAATAEPGTAAASGTTEPGTVSATGGTAPPGGEVTASFEVTNTGSADGAYVLEVRAPDGFEVTGRSDDGGTWKPSETRWLWQTVGAGESVTPSVTLAVPADASGPVTVEAVLKNADGVTARGSATVEVNESAGSTATGTGGGNSTDDGSAGGGGGITPPRSVAQATVEDGAARVEVTNGVPTATARTLLDDVSAGGATYRQLSVSFAGDAGDFAVTLEPGSDLPDDVPALAGADPVAFYRVTGGPPDSVVRTANVAFELSPDALPSGATLDDVAVFRFHDGEWRKLETTRQGDQLLARSPGFSAFAIAVTQADLAVTDATLDATEVAVGEQASVTVTVENAGTAEGTRTVDVTMAGETVASRDVTVAAGETVEVALAWTPQEAGSFEVAADGTPAGTLSVGGGTRTTTAVTTTTPGGSSTTATASGGQPGFGWLAGLLALVVGPALLARRR